MTIGDTSHIPESAVPRPGDAEPDRAGRQLVRCRRAQVDRFMLKLKLTYPTKEEELAILNRMSAIDPQLHVEAVLGPADLAELSGALDWRHVDDKTKRHRLSMPFVHAMRRPAEDGLDQRRTSSTRRSARDDLPDTYSAKASVRSKAAALSRRKTSSQSAPTCCATVSPSLTKRRRRRSRLRRLRGNASSSAVESVVMG